MRTSEQERFKSKIEKTDTCWLWLGALDKGGYGIFMSSKEGIRFPAHRASYEIFKGKIPIGLQLDHLCRNRKCVNPNHLEPVTARENNRRGFSIAALNSRKTHCKNGHELSINNLLKNRLPVRICRICNAITCKRYRKSVQNTFATR